LKYRKLITGIYVNVYLTNTLRRIYTVHPSNDECFFLYLLLVNANELTLIAFLRTINSEYCPTYWEACQCLQLLEVDIHRNHAHANVVISSIEHHFDHFFSIIISTCFPSNPFRLSIKFKDNTVEDILYQVRTTTVYLEHEFNAEIHNEALISLKYLYLMMSDKILQNLGMLASNRLMHDAFN